MKKFLIIAMLFSTIMLISTPTHYVYANELVKDGNETAPIESTNTIMRSSHRTKKVCEDKVYSYIIKGFIHNQPKGGVSFPSGGSLEIIKESKITQLIKYYQLDSLYFEIDCGYKILFQ